MTVLQENYLAMPRYDHCNLYVGDEPIPLKPFVQDFIRGTVTGMLTALDNIPSQGEIIIRLTDMKKNTSKNISDD